MSRIIDFLVNIRITKQIFKAEIKCVDGLHYLFIYLFYFFYFILPETRNYVYRSIRTNVTMEEH